MTFSGSGPSLTNFYNVSTSTNACLGSDCYVSLYDSANGVSYFPVASTTTSLLFDLNNYTVSAGTSKSFTLRINTAQTGVLQTAATGVSQTLSASISAVGSVVWTDAVSGGTANLNVPATTIPITINSVSYPQGT